MESDPTSTFASTDVEQVDRDHYRGMLVSEEVTLEFEESAIGTEAR